jgi:mannose-6-phosphate isomerase-like protein (cupin superfamily)
VVQVGDEMVNPQSGERFVWKATAASTAGAYCEFDLYLDEHAQVAAPHRHPSQVEQFSVVTGLFALTSDQGSGTYGPGQVATIAVGDAHRWSNTSGRPAHVVVRLTPALHIEDYFARFCAIATAGRAAPSGLPRNPLELGVLFDAYRAEFALSPPLLHRLASPLIALLGALGRRRGYTSGHPRDQERG